MRADWSGTWAAKRVDKMAGHWAGWTALLKAERWDARWVEWMDDCLVVSKAVLMAAWWVALMASRTADW